MVAVVGAQDLCSGQQRGGGWAGDNGGRESASGVGPAPSAATTARAALAIRTCSWLKHSSCASPPWAAVPLAATRQSILSERQTSTGSLAACMFYTPPCPALAPGGRRDQGRRVGRRTRPTHLRPPAAAAPPPGPTFSFSNRVMDTMAGRALPMLQAEGASEAAGRAGAGATCNAVMLARRRRSRCCSPVTRSATS